MTSSAFDKGYYDRLRSWRNRPEKELGIGLVMEKLAGSFRKQARASGPAMAAIAECCPPELAGRITGCTLRRGVLTLTVEDASARFTADRWLRCGGREKLLNYAPTVFLSVRLAGK